MDIPLTIFISDKNLYFSSFVHSLILYDITLCSWQVATKIIFTYECVNNASNFFFHFVYKCKQCLSTRIYFFVKIKLKKKKTQIISPKIQLPPLRNVQISEEEKNHASQCLVKIFYQTLTIETHDCRYFLWRKKKKKNRVPYESYTCAITITLVQSKVCTASCGINQ